MKSNREFFRFVINGTFAAVVHFFVLIINIEILNFQSAGLANFIAAIFGISVSFFGNRYFVFRRNDGCLIKQSVEFLILYISVACFHGFSLYLWTDVYKFRYIYGFAIISIFAVLFSYFGNKLMVFKT